MTGPSKNYSLVETDRFNNSNIHRLASGDDLATAMNAYAGEVIDLGGHTFTTSSSLPSLDSNFAGTEIRNGTVKQADGANLSTLFVSSEGTSDITFRNVTFDANRANNTTYPRGYQTFFPITGLDVISCEFIGCGYAAVALRGGSVNEVSIRQNSFEDCERSVSAEGDITDLTITDCLVTAPTATISDIIYVENTNGSNENIYISRVNSAASPTRYSIRVNEGTNVRISECNVFSVKQYFDTSTTGGSADNISVTRSSDVVIENCRVNGSGDVGITVENNSTNVTVLNNTIFECDAWAISIAAAAGTIDNVGVVDNKCFNNTQDYSARTLVSYSAIHIGGATDCTIRGNVCYDDQGTSTQEYGIVERNGADFNLSIGNILRNNGTGAFDGALPANSIRANNLT